MRDAPRCAPLQAQRQRAALLLFESAMLRVPLLPLRVTPIR